MPLIDEIGISLPTALKWGRRLAFSILDQGLFSGANFLISILLGRWLPPEAYGAYGVAFSIMLIIAGIQSSIIFEPMRVYGTTQFNKNLSDYIGKLILLQLTITIPFSILIAIASLFLNSYLKEALLWMAIAMPFYLGIILLRQSCYLESRSSLASTGSLIYFCVSIIGMILIYTMGKLSITSYYAINILGSISGLAFLTRVLLREKEKERVFYTYREIIKQHWTYGRWLLPATIANSIAILIIPPVLSILRGLQETGAYKAYQNFITPFSQLIVAINLLSLPVLSREFSEAGRKKANRLFLRIFTLSTGLLILYLVPLTIWGENIISWLYKNDFYMSFYHLFPIIPGIIILNLLASLLGLKVRYLQRPNTILYSKAASAGATVLLIYPLISAFGLAGSLYLIVITLLIEISILLFSK